MSPQDDRHFQDSPLDGARSALREMILTLERRKSEVMEEIVNYPPPIPACDAQFDYLLEQRDQLANELTRLREFDASKVTLPACIAILDELAAKTDLISVEAEQRIRSHLGGKSAAGGCRDRECG